MHNLNEGELSHRLGGFSQIIVVDDESAEVLRREKERSTIHRFRTPEIGRAFVRPGRDLHNIANHSVPQSPGEHRCRRRRESSSGAEHVSQLLAGVRRVLAIVKIGFMDSGMPSVSTTRGPLRPLVWSMPLPRALCVFNSPRERVCSGKVDADGHAADRDIPFNL